MTPSIRALFLLVFFSAIFSCTSLPTPENDTIDRYALVTRHNVQISKPDSLGAISVGNGEFAFTADVTGLQSFPEYYENGIPLGTQSQWGWHSFSNDGDYRIEDVAVAYESCNDKSFPVAIQHLDGLAGAATHWLRTNPHRLHLGLVGLVLTKENGREINITDLQNIEQELDLWSGKLTSKYEIDGIPVKVELFTHQDQDLIAFRIESDLIQQQRLKIKFRFPYGSDCHVCPGYDWSKPESHQTRILSQTDGQAWLERTLDSTVYHVGIGWSPGARLTEQASHHFELSPDQQSATFEASVLFTPKKRAETIPDFEQVQQNNTQSWAAFWQEGGAIDFSACTDPRAVELERRVVLSQYLTKIQCAGSYPPQETGLNSNSWYGKYHLEMHWWHGVHFALWNRIELLEKSMGWYDEVLDEARAVARWQGFEGVRWPKMTTPAGQSSPSNVGEFLIWQQPHPIYFAELFYRHTPEKATLERFQDIVFETADFMASFAQLNPEDGKYHLCQPLIPAQEIFHPTETNDPPFELVYWYYGLQTAQQWRLRLGLPSKPEWQEVIDKLAGLPEAEGLYLPCANAFEAYTDDSNRRDHPIVTGAYGMLPSTPLVDTTIMANTLEEILKEWNWNTTWGWDYPMLAMSAARLGKPELAVDALLMDVQKNTYLVNGHNFQNNRLRLYLPGNGGILTAVAMMAAGWENGPQQSSPGFPQNGQWNIKWENLKTMQ